MKWLNICVIFLMIGGAALLLRWVFLLKENLRREQEENRRLRALLQTGFHLAQADLEQLRQLRHDLRHYLVLAADAPIPAETAAALRSALDKAPPKAHQENWIISALEQHYLEQAAALGFQADLRIIPPQAWDDLLPDLCLIVSNLLENSLEALQREGGGWLRARSVSTSGYFSLVVGNSCTRPLRSLNGHYLSSKSPGRFGIGLATIQEVAQHYGGNAEFTVENGEFRASIFLPRAMSFIQSVRAPSSPNTAVSTCSGEYTKR